MTIMLPPAPAAPDIASFSPADSAREPLERGVSFGPALSRAQERMARPEPTRSHSAEHRPDRTDRPKARDAEPANEDSTAAGDADGVADDTADADVDESRDVTDHDEAEHTESDSQATTGAAEVAQNKTTAAAAIVTPTIHPTAKGAAGDGDPSTDPAVEEVVTPDDGLTTAVDVDDGSTPAEADAAVTTVLDGGDESARDAGRQTALTSLEQVVDTNLELAQRVVPASSEEIDGRVSADSKRTDPFSGSEIESVRLDGFEARVERASASEDDALPADAASGDSVEIDGLQPGARMTEPTERSAQQTSLGTAKTADTPDAVVVLAREAARAPESAQPTAAASTPTPAPLEGAEANLWEDVRSAFDRIRSTGDGQEVRIKLRPAELGELLVQVRTQGDHVAVRLVASSAAAQQTLIDDRLRLAAELARAGFDEGSVDIGQQNPSDSNRQGHESDQHDRSRQTARGIGVGGGLDHVGLTRELFERRDPIRTDSGFRPGRTVHSTISLTL